MLMSTRTRRRLGTRHKGMRLFLDDSGIIPPLDLVPNAAAGYSVARKLRTAYAGSALRLRQRNSITGIIVLSHTFQISTDKTVAFAPGVTFVVSGSTGGLNDGTYTVISSSYTPTTTSIIVVESIPSAAVIDGVIDVEKDFGFVGNNMDTAGITAWLQGASGLIRTIYDQSGNGRDVVQATTTKQPLYVSNGKNGQAVARFDGVDDFMKASAFTFNQPETVLLAFKQTVGSGDKYLIDGNTVEKMLFLSSGSAISLFAGSAAAPSVTAARGSWWILAGVFNGASSTIQLNAGAAVTGDPGAQNAGGLTIGSRGDGGGNFFLGDAAECIAYAGAKSSADILTLISNQNNFFSIF